MNYSTPDVAPGSASATASPGSRPDNVAVVVIHGVGEAEIGWINDYIVTELGKREPAMSFDPYSQVYRLPDKGRTKPGAMFRTVVRRARIADRVNVTFAELHWADLSRVGNGAVARFLTMLQLFFEAPQVLGSSLLAETSTGIMGWIRQLILTSIWLLRWPIAGMTLSLFISSFGMMLYDRLLRVEYLKPMLTMPPGSLHYLVGSLLALTALTGLALAYLRYRHDIALTDLGLATALFATLMLAGLVLVSLLGIGEAGDLQDRTAYLAVTGNIIIWTFALWNITIIGTMVLMLLVWIGRLFRSRPSKRYPLHRAAAAAGLTVIQGMLWKLVVCPVSLFIIFMQVERRAGFRRYDPNNGWADENIYKIVDSLVIVAVTNAIMTGLVVASIALVLLARTLMCRRGSAQLMLGQVALPRLIASPLFLVVLFVGQFGSATMFYFAQHWPSVASWLDRNLTDESTISGLRQFLTSAMLLSIVPYIWGALTKASTGVLHVARDIVDHQYAPRYVVAKFRLPAWLQQRGTHPRRERIQKRLEALIEGIMTTERFDRLVFLTHSQGTVIMHDYLRSARDNKMPGNIARIDAITLASPLSHLYQHYFRAYQAQVGSATILNPKLASWTNVWRIDDPIGGRVDIVTDGFVKNQPLPEGGHVNYWREERVCEVILDIIDPTPAAAAASAVVAASPRRS